MKASPVLSNMFNFFNFYNFLEYVNIIRKHNSDVFTHSKNLDMKSNIPKRWIRFLDVPVLKVWVSVIKLWVSVKDWVSVKVCVSVKIKDNATKDYAMNYPMKDYAKKNWAIRNLNTNSKVLECSIKLVREGISVELLPIKLSERDGERSKSETLYSGSIRAVKRFLGSLFNVYIWVLCVRWNSNSKGSRRLCLQNVNIRNGLLEACKDI